MLGYVIPLASALAHTGSLPEFVAWAALAGVIQIVAFWAVRRIVLPDVSARIERGDVGRDLPAHHFAGGGCPNAACMTG